MSHSRNGNGQTESDPVNAHQITSLIRALHAQQPDPISCAECRNHLAALYHMQHTESLLPAEYERYQAHIESCPECRIEFMALCDVLDAFEADTLPDLAQPPIFDLSFMDAAIDSTKDEAVDAAIDTSVDTTNVDATKDATLPPTLWLSRLAADLHSLAGDVIVMVERAKATFERLPWLPEVALVPAPTLRGDTSNDTNAERNKGTSTGQAELLVLPAPDADLSLHLSVGPVVGGTAAIAIKLSELSSGKPLSAMRVTLRNVQRQLLIGAVTNEEGMTVFEQLSLGRYFIQVRHSQQTWEIPLVLVEGSLAVGAQPAS